MCERAKDKKLCLFLEETLRGEPDEETKKTFSGEKRPEVSISDKAVYEQSGDLWKHKVLLPSRSPFLLLSRSKLMFFSRE